MAVGLAAGLAKGLMGAGKVVGGAARVGGRVLGTATRRIATRKLLNRRKRKGVKLKASKTVEFEPAPGLKESL